MPTDIYFLSEVVILENWPKSGKPKQCVGTSYLERPSCSTGIQDGWMHSNTSKPRKSY